MDLFNEEEIATIISGYDLLFEVRRENNKIGSFVGIKIVSEKYIAVKKTDIVFQEGDLLVSNGGKKYTINRIARIAGAIRLYY